MLDGHTAICERAEEELDFQKLLDNPDLISSTLGRYCFPGLDKPMSLPVVKSSIPSAKERSKPILTTYPKLYLNHDLRNRPGDNRVIP